MFQITRTAHTQALIFLYLAHKEQFIKAIIKINLILIEIDTNFSNEIKAMRKWCLCANIEIKQTNEQNLP